MNPELPGPSDKAGTATPEQRLALLGVFARDGHAHSRAYRLEWLAQRIPGWNHGGELDWLSERQAGDLLAAAAGVDPARESHGLLADSEAKQL